MNERRRRALIILLTVCVFVAAFMVFWYHAAPTVTFHDSGELALAAACGGIPHPPGAPSWTMAATAFVHIFGFADAARGTNLLSGLFGALTLAGLFYLTTRWVRLVLPGLPTYVVSLCGLVSCLVLIRSPAFIEQSTTTEQYTLMTFLIVSLLIALSHYVAQGRGSPLHQKEDRSNIRLLFLIGLIWGLSIANHLSQVYLGLLIGWVLIVSFSRPCRLRDVLFRSFACSFGLALGLLSFLWVLIRSRANPILDWGNIETLDRLLWALTRQQWASRPLSDAPPGFVKEWLLSYNLLGQLGAIGLALSLGGLLVLARRRSRLIGWITIIIVPYSAGMLLGHMKQELMDVSYIRGYGVTDWHLPVYLGFSISAGIGAATLLSVIGSRKRWFATTFAFALIGVLVSNASSSVSRCSLRDWNGPVRYLQTVLEPIPPDAVIVASTDNISHMLAYHNYGHPQGTDFWFAYGTRHVQSVISELLKSGREWDQDEKVRYLTVTLLNPLEQPLRVHPLPAKEAARRPLYVEYSPGHEEAAGWLLPSGYLFQVMDRRVSNREVLLAEQQWKEAFPEGLACSSQNVRRLEREACSLLHQRRGGYFQAWGMWPEAFAAYRISLDWLDTNGEVWFCLGYVCEQLEKPAEAATAYVSAIEYAPHLPGPRVNLAILRAQAGQLEAAEMLLNEELKNHPDSKQAKTNLALVRKLLKEKQ